MCKNFIQNFIFLVAINNFRLPKSQFLNLTEFTFGFTSNVVLILLISLLYNYKELRLIHIMLFFSLLFIN